MDRGVCGGGQRVYRGMQRHNSQQLLDWPKDKKLSVHALAKKFSISYTILYKRINKWVTGQSIGLEEKEIVEFSQSNTKVN